MRRPAALFAALFLGGCVGSCASDDAAMDGPRMHAAIHVEPESLELYAIGSTVALQATVVDTWGSPVHATGLRWSSDDPLVATVDPSGVVTAVGEGRAQVWATLGSLRAAAQVRIAPIPQGIAALEILPRAPLLTRIGQTLQLRAVALDAQGEALGDVPARWSTSDDGVVEVDEAGVVLAVEGGVATVTATLPDGSLSSQLEVWVRPAPPEVLSFDTLAAGVDSTCGLLASGAAYCFGANRWWQLGLGTFGVDDQIPALAPTLAKPDDHFVHLAVGDGTTCAARKAGELRCWGRALGPDPAYADLVFELDAPVVQVALGRDHVCALDELGAIHCGGDNERGQLGTGDTRGRLTPGMVDGAGFVEVAAGGDFTCARTEDGATHCWGANDRGQLAGGTDDDASPTPLEIDAPPLVALSVGDAHACGITEAGELRCWGAGDRGQLGTGDFDDQDAPAAVLPPEGDPFVSVAAGAAHTCATTSLGRAFCWGDGGDGRLGAPAPSPIEPDPVEVPIPDGEDGFVSVTSGAAHTCALAASGSAYCWGMGVDGRLGTGDDRSRDAPTLVQGTGR